MLARALAAPLAVVGTVLTTAATLTPRSETQALLYVADTGRDLELRAISPEGTGASTIVSLGSGPIYRVTLSPNDKALAVESNERISTITLSDGARRLVASNAAEYTWAPDSKRIAYRTLAANAQVYIVRLDGSERRRLTRTQRPNRTLLTYRGLAWAPKGRRIAFARWQVYDSYHPPVAGRILTITTSGKQTVLAKAPRFVPATLAWSPSGARIAAGGFADAGVVIVPAGRGKVQFVRGTDCCIGVSSLAWSPNGKRLAFLGADTSSGLPPGGVVKLGARHATVFTQFDGAGDPVWSRDSSRLAFVGCHGDRCDLYLSDPEGLNVKRIDGTDDASVLLDWTG